MLLVSVACFRSKIVANEAKMFNRLKQDLSRRSVTAVTAVPPDSAKSRLKLETSSGESLRSSVLMRYTRPEDLSTCQENEIWRCGRKIREGQSIK